ncbi:MAG: YgcG family protein [Acetobacteraceae bacterium]
MRARNAVLLGLVLALVLICGALAELAFPPLSGRVVDAAGVLDAKTRAALEQRLAAQEAKSTDQVVVATVPSLQGTSVEDYANRLFRFWKLGQATKDNGVLLLVAPAEHKVRIEVGYGLEGVLPDAVSSTIIQTAMLPLLRKGDYAGAIDKGVDSVIEILNLDPAELAERAKRDAQPTTRGIDQGDWEAWVLLAIFLLVWVVMFRRASRNWGRSRTMRRPGGFGGAPMVVPWVFPRSGGFGGGGFGGGSGGGFSGGGGSSGGGGASGSR